MIKLKGEGGFWMIKHGWGSPYRDALNLGGGGRGGDREVEWGVWIYMEANRVSDISPSSLYCIRVPSTSPPSSPRCLIDSLAVAGISLVVCCAKTGHHIMSLEYSLIASCRFSI